MPSFTNLAHLGHSTIADHPNPSFDQFIAILVGHYSDFHLVIGHHGFYSLTPIFIFALFAMIRQLWEGDSFWRPLAKITLSLTAILLVFYVFRPLPDRNYGGVASGFRWMFWLIPLYSLFLIPGILKIKHSFFLMVLLLGAIAVSVYSSHYALLNPWQNPWPY